MHKSTKCHRQSAGIRHCTLSFANALRAPLPQDLDIILVGENAGSGYDSVGLNRSRNRAPGVCDPHTSGAPKTIDRIIDAFHPTSRRRSAHSCRKPWKRCDPNLAKRKRRPGCCRGNHGGTTACGISFAKANSIRFRHHASQPKTHQTMDVAMDRLARRPRRQSRAQSRSMIPIYFSRRS